MSSRRISAVLAYETDSERREFRVDRYGVVDGYDFCDRVKRIWSNELASVEVSALELFENEQSFRARSHLSKLQSIGAMGSDPGNPLIVHVPVVMRRRGYALFDRLLDPDSPTVVKSERDLNHSCKWTDNFFVIPQEISMEIFKVNASIVLHRRAAVRVLYNRLNTRNRALVKGPPGVGKSTCTFAMALCQAAEANERILWVQADFKRYVIIEKSRLEVFLIDKGCLDQVILALVERNAFDRIYIDQCQLIHGRSPTHFSLLFSLIRGWAKKIRGRSCFAIASNCCVDLYGAGFVARDIVELTSWTFEEYMAALKHPEAKRNFTRSLLLGEDPSRDGEWAKVKYYYAGDSARLFFEYPSHKIRHIVDLGLSTSAGCLEAMMNGDEPRESPLGVDRLFHAMQDGCKWFSSGYIADTVLELNLIKPDTFAKCFANLGFRSTDKSLDTVFEFYALSMISWSRWDPLEKRRPTDCPYSRPCRVAAERIMNRYQGSPTETVEVGFWYKPAKFVYPSISAFHAFGTYRESLLEELVVVLVQATSAARALEFNPQEFASAAWSIISKVRGVVEKTTKVIIPQRPHTRLYIEIVFAVPRGKASTLEVKQTNPSYLLQRLDERWSKPIFQIVEVPDLI